jgi:hypothetical protein
VSEHLSTVSVFAPGTDSPRFPCGVVLRWELKGACWGAVQGLVRATMGACADPLTKKQLGYLLARQGVALDLEAGEVGSDSHPHACMLPCTTCVRSPVGDLRPCQALCPDEALPSLSQATWCTPPARG